MIRYLFIHILFFALLPCSISAQSKADKKKAKKFNKEALSYFETDDYSNAWKNYRAALAIDPADERAAINAAVSAINLRYAVDSFRYVTQTLQSSKLSEAKYNLAVIYHRQLKLDEALSLVESELTLPASKRKTTDQELETLRKYCTNAKSFISRPHRSVISNIGPAINSKYDDYVPVILPDESAMYFTSKRAGSTGNTRNGDDKFFEDVYVSQRVDGVWKPAENLGVPVNSETNDACTAISPDGQRMIIYRTAADKVTGDLYISTQVRTNKWGPLQLMSGQINSRSIETSACFSMDTAELYFSSDRPGGFGGKDLYRIKKLPNGAWSVPMNLGPNVNTALDEDSPFLHADGVTLYFSSKGHNSMGDYDVFRAVWNSETNEFGEAENLGYPINNVESDIFFVINVNGKRGYYSSVKEETLGGSDIYEIDTRFGDNDLSVRIGYTYLENGPARIRLTLFDEETGNMEGTYQSHPETGKFILILNPLKKYSLLAEEDDYKPETIQLKPLVQEKTERFVWIMLKKDSIAK